MTVARHVGAVVWTPELRREITPRSAASLKEPDPARAWKVARHRYDKLREPFQKGLTKEGAAVAEMRAAIDLMHSVGQTFAGADLGALAAVIALEQAARNPVPVIAAIGEACGVEVATRALLRAHELELRVSSPTSMLIGTLAVQPFGWRGLRVVTLRAGEAAALAVAREVWEQASLPVRIVLAHALPSSPELAAEVAQQVAALPEGDRLLVAPVLASLRDATHLTGLLAHRFGASSLVDAVENLGMAALPSLLSAWERKTLGDRAHLARATSCYADERAASVLARELTKKTSAQIARDYFLRLPELAAVVLEPVARGRSRLAFMAGELIARGARASKDAVEAPLEELPGVLSRPPWIHRERTRARPRVVEIPEPSGPERICWPERGRAARAATIGFGSMATDADIDAYRKNLSATGAGYAWWFRQGRVPDAVQLELVTTGGFGPSTPPWFAVQALAHLGQPVLAPFVDWIGRSMPQLAGFLFNLGVEEMVDSPRLARLLFGWLDTAPVVWRYFHRHPATTAAALWPLALAGDAKAGRFMRRLAQRHPGEVEAPLASLPTTAAQAARDVLALDARLDCPNKPPKLPASWRADALTRPRLQDGRLLPLAAIDPIGHMLAFSTLDHPYAGLDDVKAVCDPRTLAELAWDTGRAWELGGAKHKDEWMLDAIAHLGDDEVIRRTTPAITHPRVIAVLAAAGTDAALVELCTIRWRSRALPRSGTSRLVDDALTKLARSRGCSFDELIDQLMPMHHTLRVELDYGTRVIHVGFDERLEPYIEGARGRLRELPKAGKRDDPAKVARAERMWDELLEDVAAVAHMRVTALEEAMVSGRAWSLERFRAAWLRHPLMRHLTRGMIWRSRGVCFRVADDDTFADAEDHPLADVEDVSVPHAAEMTEAERARWAEVLSDYELLQPFEQLARRVVTLPAGDPMRAVLVPATAPSLAAFGERCARTGFEWVWRDNKQIRVRVASRTGHRILLSPEAHGDRLERVVLTAEMEQQQQPLAELHVVDIAEVAHALELTRDSDR